MEDSRRRPRSRAGAAGKAELYVEPLTRIATQPLPDRDGDEKTALDSGHSLFGTTREIVHAGQRRAFREEPDELQKDLRNYTRLLDCSPRSRR